ncbi:MAG: hemolysin III family protein [Solobacterium sp.]|nr:hemolysin III family protein [Solobacterium sp.]
MSAMNMEYGQPGTFRVKDPVSTLTHFIGFLMSIAAMPLLLIHHMNHGAQMSDLCADAVFMLSMILLYGASSAYHAFDVRRDAAAALKKTDHMSIFILIAGTYTPVCVSILPHRTGMILLYVIWSIAAAGLIFKFCWVTCPRWVSSVLYTGMGWAAVSVLPSLLEVMSPAEFVLLLSGGIIYSAGGVIYALKKRITPISWEGFGNHELFHIFVMLGSLCHFLMIFIHSFF